MTTKTRVYQDPPFARFLFSNTKTAWFWLIVRVYVGWAWLSAGWGKIQSSSWVGENAGAPIEGFVHGALEKTAGAHPDVQMWYAWFLENIVLPNSSFWSHLVAWGEVLVGIALLLGVFVGIAAFFGALMNLSFLLAGTVSINPVLFTLSIGLMLGWKVAGHLGLDRFLLPMLGTPWEPGSAFKRRS